jgi:nifR3 family TIM-barrel protein
MGMTGKTKTPLPTGFTIGPIGLSCNVLLAPMSGITDAPFRRLVEYFGLGLSYSEMVACRELACNSEDAMRRLVRTSADIPFAVQIAGRDTGLMVQAARIAEDSGADILDINLGCPAKRVTGGLAGAALMREPLKALKMIEAVIGAVDIPVTVKMRLGWDENTRNAPEIARDAEGAGVSMICVHARTRQQFYKGRANWACLRKVREVTSLPLAVNGDISSVEDAHEALAQSGADAVMLGRGVLGRPWLPMQVGRALAGEAHVDDPPLAQQCQIVQRHYHDILDHYGQAVGIRCARKHLAAYLEAAGEAFAVETTAWRSLVCRSKDPVEVVDLVCLFYRELEQRRAA